MGMAIGDAMLDGAGLRSGLYSGVGCPAVAVNVSGDLVLMVIPALAISRRIAWIKAGEIDWIPLIRRLRDGLVVGVQDGISCQTVVNGGHVVYASLFRLLGV